MLCLFGWVFIHAGVNLFVEFTENNESVHLVNVTRFLVYRSGGLESSRSCLCVAVKNMCYVLTSGHFSWFLSCLGVWF